MKSKTLAIIKPDAVRAKNIGEIITEIENSDFEIVDMGMFKLTYSLAEQFYVSHQGKDFFDRLCHFTSSGLLVAMVLETEGDAVEKWRKMIGNTYPEKAEPDTLRAKYGTPSIYWDYYYSNALHGTDSIENVKYEIDFFFGNM